LAAKEGLKVVLIEEKDLGGVCLNKGCIPTKTLVYLADSFRRISSLKEYGLNVDKVDIDYSKLFQKKDKIIGDLRLGIESTLDKNKVIIIRQKAQLIDKNHVKAGSNEFETNYIFIATGAISKTIDSYESLGLFNSDTILNYDRKIDSLAIIGGGVIGMEFASIYASLGTKVYVIEALDDILLNFDSSTIKRLKVMLKKKGIEIFTKTVIDSISKTKDNYHLFLNSKGEIVCEKILLAIGRKPNVNSLDLNSVGIEFNQAGIKVNENFQTNIENIYAIGDINNKMMLAHVASAQGRIALNHILERPNKIDINLVPKIIYTSPMVASIGLSEDECKQKNINYKNYKSMYARNGKAYLSGEIEGNIKIIVDENSQIIGCQIIGDYADIIIHEMILAINKKMSVEEMLSIIHAHPSLSEIVFEALLDI
ncbi:MAG: dihydrolipoyl dehydrogenase, partial [Bacilli bacterium]|nr:dihydrolipoyl dehydrogenase [Bacilli bacterium]